MSSEPRDRQSDLAVMDEREYVQKSELRALKEARKKVEEKEDEAEELYITGEISEQARNMIVLKAVREFIREAWPLLLNHAEEMRERHGDRSEYLETRHLGKLELENRTVEFNGLWDVLKCQDLFIERRKVQRQFKHGPSETVMESETYTVPLSVSWEAYLTLREFLAEENGIELKTEKMDDRLPEGGYQTLVADGIEEIEFHDGPIDLRGIQNGHE